MTYVELHLKQLKLPTLKYRRLRGDMIEVFKIEHNHLLRSRSFSKISF